jgi:hypothetical protein
MTSSSQLDLNCHTPSWVLKSAPSLTTVLRGRNVLRTLRVVFGSTLHCILGKFPACIHSLMPVRIDLLVELEEDDDGRLDACEDEEERRGLPFLR